MRRKRSLWIFLLGIGLLSSAAAGETKILINHIGFDPAASKRAVIQGVAGGSWSSFRVIDAATEKVALTGSVASV